MFAHSAATPNCMTRKRASPYLGQATLTSSPSFRIALHDVGPLPRSWARGGRCALKVVQYMVEAKAPSPPCNPRHNNAHKALAQVVGMRPPPAFRAIILSVLVCGGWHGEGSAINHGLNHLQGIIPALQVWGNEPIPTTAMRNKGDGVMVVWPKGVGQECKRYRNNLCNIRPSRQAFGRFKALPNT